MAGRRETWLTEGTTNTVPLNSVREEGVKRRPDGHIDHFARTHLPNIAVARQQIDYQHDQQSHADECKAQQGSLIELQVGVDHPANPDNQKQEDQHAYKR